MFRRVQWQAGRLGQQGLRERGRARWLSGKVTPHTLRHTAAAWLVQRGVPVWETSRCLGMSAEVLLRTCGHDHPEFLRCAANAITSKHRWLDQWLTLKMLNKKGKNPNEIMVGSKH
jgi:hypothetical protein